MSQDSRLVQVVRKAEKVLGDSELALKWLQEGQLAFDGKAPIKLIRTKKGFTRVMDQLVRMEHCVCS